MLRTATTLLKQIVCFSRRLSGLDLCEGSAGNLSILLSEEEISGWQHPESVPGSFVKLESRVGNLGGKYLLISASGARLSTLATDPESKLALLEMDNSGSSYRVIWGLDKGGKPSSELMVHLLGHQALMTSRAPGRVLFHCHPLYAVTLSAICSFTTEELTRLFWHFHTEGRAFFEEGAAAIKALAPGSMELATQTASLLSKHRYLLWERHGVIASGASLEECLSLVEVSEKILRIAYLATANPHQSANLMNQVNKGYT